MIPLFTISSLVEALFYDETEHLMSIHGLHLREVRDVSQDIQDGADGKTKRASDLERSNGIFDIVEDVIHVRPSCVSVENFECGRCILKMTVNDCLSNIDTLHSRHYCCVSFLQKHS